MRSVRPSRFDLSALGHPLWWGALALLVINDNFLKGRGVVPGWLTGKLSDFAFLVVTPVLLAALLPRALRARRTLALVAIVGLFVAADLSAAVSNAVVAAAAQLGMRWQLWPDPTDLAALAVLPVTVWLMRRPPRDVRPTVGRRARERAGVALGAVACLATSAPRWPTHFPFLVNRTTARADMRVTWVLRKIDCATAPELLAETLKTSDLDDARTYSLDIGQVAVLDGPRSVDNPPVGSCSPQSTTSGGTCVAAILEAPAAAPVLMVAQPNWIESGDDSFITCSSPPPSTRCSPTLSPAIDPGPDAVSLVVIGGVTSFENRSVGTHRKVEIVPIDLAALAMRTPDPDGCRPMRDAYKAQLADTACAAHADCRLVAGLALPGETFVCDLYLAAPAAAAVENIATKWPAACLTGPLYGIAPCAPPQPAGCVDGGCAAICGQKQLPMCPPSCVPYSTADLCRLNVACAQDNGDVCVCSGGKLSCYTPSPPGPDCPITCIPWQDAGAP